MARKKPEQQLSALAKRFGAIGVQPARIILTNVRAVPTRFCQVDFATRVWGWPIQRCAVVHGPSNEGKTAFVLGLCGSFVSAGGVAKYDDAERTTTSKWATELLGEGIALNDRFMATRPDSYEKCVDESRAWHKAVREAREAGELPETASGIQIVDSLRKLVPEDILAKIKKEGAGGAKGSVDGMGGRAAQIRAALNSAWLDELVPLTDTCGTAWLAIARESEDPDADLWDKKFGNDYKVQGGKGVVYDSALRTRIERDGWVTIPDGDKKKIIGERHKVSILKTKVGGKEGRATVAYFHTSLGVTSPVGFDRARDVVELAEKFGIVESGTGGTFWKGSRFRSYEKLVEALTACDGDREEMEDAVRARFTDEEVHDDARLAASAEATKEA